MPVFRLEWRMPSLLQNHPVTDIRGLTERLASHRPRRLPGRRYMARCGVAAVFSQRAEHDGLSVLMMRRATRSGDPWSGHMAFPGGRMEPGDRHTLGTAIRETAEEIGWDLQAEQRIGRLSDVVTRQHARMLPMTVTPHVFALPGGIDPRWQLNHEVAEVVWVPLDYFAEKHNRKKMHWRTGRITWEMPCFFYQERRIWGLSLLMLRELMGITHGVKWRNMKPVRASTTADEPGPV